MLNRKIDYTCSSCRFAAYEVRIKLIVLEVRPHSLQVVVWNILFVKIDERVQKLINLHRYKQDKVLGNVPMVLYTCSISNTSSV